MEQNKGANTKIFLIIGGLCSCFALIACAIVMVVLALGVFGVRKTIDTANDTSAKVSARSIQVALEQYYEENMDYPYSLNELEPDYIVSVDISESIVYYHRLSSSRYTLSVTLPSGEKYVLSD